MGEMTHAWIQAALVSAASIVIVYWYTWSTGQHPDLRKLIIVTIITFITAFLADLLGDEIIKMIEE